jgi:flagellar hook protein FlgE
MLRSLTSGVSAMKNFQSQLDVIGNNVANVNTTGFKSSTVNFADALSDSLVNSGSGATNQIGSGVTIDNVSTNFTQGTVNSTGNASDLAISGNGYFVVRDTTTGNEYASRAGNFSVDSSGYLITSQGYRVQGYNDSSLSSIGDIQIDINGSSSTAALSTYSFSSTGVLTVTQEDGTSFARGQVLMQNFTAPQNLVKEGDNLYSGMGLAGALSTISASGTNGLGTIKSKSLEASNVDLTTELTSMITTERAYQASSKIITTSDEVLQDLVNLKR